MDLNDTLPKIFIHESELDFVARCVMDFPETETGGDFFGLWTKEGYPVIQYVIGPGEQTTQTVASFFQDIGYLKECGFLLNNRYGLQHIGAWHSHHKLDLFEPSQGDINTMKKALEDTKLSSFVISICNMDHLAEVSINGYLFSKGNLQHYTNCNWHILDGNSPVRESLEKDEVSLLDLFINPKTQPADFHVKNIEQSDEVVEREIQEKPELPENSYWNQEEGRKYLKKVYDQMSNREDLSGVELLQLVDKRVAISFNHQGKSYEIRFPANFPNKDAEVVEKMNVNDVMKIVLRPVKKEKGSIRKFLDTINIFSSK